ncbi:MAG: hypothetical protein J6R13_05835 [Alistipes sp.]|nr:hypothetical protein [Alistipes sp.]
MNAIQNIFKGDIKLNDELTTREYRLMYYFGVWYTHSTIYAECDAEAIFDARTEFKAVKSADKLPYALWCGNRLVKRFNYTGSPYNPTFTNN